MNEFIANFHFIRPAWLLLALPTLVIAYLLMQREATALQWKSVVAKHLLPFLVDGKSIQQKKYPLYLLLMLWLLAIVALAGPTWTKLAEPVEQKTDALVIAWDLSPSMLAQDIKPSRLVRARLKLTDLLRDRKEGLTALIAYSGEAHVVTPLTDDTDTIISLLGGLDPNIMPAKGSNAEMALEMANQLMKDSGILHGNILFLTDGIDLSAHLDLRQILDTTQHKVSIWGIGSAEGAPIPLANGGFARDYDGNIVIPKLKENQLSELASELGGVYVPFTNDSRDLETLQNFVFTSPEKNFQEKSKMFDQWYEHGPYLLLLLLPFAALAFRRGWVICLAAIALASPIEQAQAMDWQDLWLTDDQQGQKLLEQDPQAAAETFKDKDWKAIANYKAGNYQEALKGFNEEGAEDLYNRGNSLTQLGKYDEAIQTYQDALKQNPDYEAAKHNLSIAEKLKDLSEQQSQQNQQQSEDSDSQNQNQENQQQDQQNSSQDSSGQDSNDSQQDNQEQSSDKQQQSSDQDQQQSADEQQQAENEANGQTRQTPKNNQQQQQALDETYGQKQDDEKPDKAAERQQPLAQAGEKDENQSDEEQQATAALSPEQREQQEAQQSLEQWLRKVPDDPSGLLRNKFRYEYGQRKRTQTRRDMQHPDGENYEQRW